MPQNKLKIGSGKWTGYEPLYLAEQVGIFEKNEASVELVRHLSEEDSINLLRNGEIHGAAITLDMIFVLHESGFPVKAVLIMDYSLGGDMIIARTGIKEISGLKGKKIGMEKLYVNEYFLARALAENNISTQEIEVVIVKSEDQADAIEKGVIDAVVAYNPQATRLIQKGYDILFTSKDIPSSIIDVLVFPAAIYRENYDNIRRIVQSWFDSLRYINLHYKGAMLIMAEGEDVSEYEFKIAFEDISIPGIEENMAFFDLESEKNIFKISDITLDFMIKKKMLSKKIDSSEIFDNSILRLIK